MKIIKFKSQEGEELHDSGYRYIKVEGENGEDLGGNHDVIHLQLGGVFGPWINIDCQSDGTFRLFCFPSPEGPEFIVDEYYPFTSSLMIPVVGERLPKKEVP